MAAGDEAELIHMVATAVAHDAGPIAFRYPRGEGAEVELPARGQILEIGSGCVMREGTDVAILSYGAHLVEALKAAEMLEAEGISVTVADARFVKPLDTVLIDQLCAHHTGLVTLEQGAKGGFGAQVLQYLANSGGLDRGIAVRTMTLPDVFIDQASPAVMNAEAGMLSGDIVRLVDGVAARHRAKRVPLVAKPKLV